MAEWCVIAVCDGKDMIFYLEIVNQDNDLGVAGNPEIFLAAANLY